MNWYKISYTPEEESAISRLQSPYAQVAGDESVLIEKAVNMSGGIPELSGRITRIIGDNSMSGAYGMVKRPGGTDPSAGLRTVYVNPSAIKQTISTYYGQGFDENNEQHMAAFLFIMQGVIGKHEAGIHARRGQESIERGDADVGSLLGPEGEAESAFGPTHIKQYFEQQSPVS